MTTSTQERLAPELQNEWDAFFKRYGKFPPREKMGMAERYNFDIRLDAWIEGRAALRKEIGK
jgi:hypothetical protein